MEIKNKYIIGTHIMFYEIEMAREHIESIINATNRVANKENVMIDLLFNISEYFEKVDVNQISKDELKQKFIELIEMLRANDINVRYNFYDNDDEPLTMVDYRRDLNYNNCKKYDYVIWGETDCLLPRELFQALESIKEYANQNNINKYVTTFAVRKMWDDSWKPLEHPDFTDKTYYETKLPDGSRDDRAFNEPHSIRYTMSLEEMYEVNDRAEQFNIQILNYPQFDGSCLVLSSDLLKNGVNVPHCVMGHLVDDTSMMMSCKQLLGNNYVQFVIKNVLKVHNRMNPLKRKYALDMDGKRDLEKSTTGKKGDWFYLMRELVHQNLNKFGSHQGKFNTYEDFKKLLKQSEEKND